MIEKLRAWWASHGMSVAVGAMMLIFFAFLAGHCEGRRSVKPVVKVETKEVVVEKVVTRDVVKTEVVHDVVDRVRVVKEVVVETRPDGTKIETRREEGETTKETKDAAAASHEVARAEERSRTTARVETTTAPAPRDRWLIGVDTTASVPGLIGGARTSYLPGAPGWLVVGATVQRRVLGPIWIGARVDSGARLGVGLSWTF
jgi:hypothetical protein